MQAEQHQRPDLLEYEEDEYEYEYDDEYDDEGSNVESNLDQATFSKLELPIQTRKRKHYILETSVCPTCKQEAHAPIEDCVMAAQWLERVRNKSSGIITVDPKVVMDALYKRFDDFAKLHNMDSPESAASWLRSNNWNEAAYAIREVIDIETEQFLLSTVIEPDEVMEEQSLVENVTFSCEICFAEDLIEAEVMAMECGHLFCRSCWSQYLTTQLASPSTTPVQGFLPTCPGVRCNKIVGHEQVRDVVPELISTYDKNQLVSFLFHNRRTLRWCPGPDCMNVAVKSSNPAFDNRADVTLCDKCQHLFSFEEGRILIAQDVELSSSLGEKKKIQRCPNCSSPIEKNGGCNHMRCRCGHHFCWICLQDTSIGHYACSTATHAMRNGTIPQQTYMLPPINLEYIVDSISRFQRERTAGETYVLENATKLRAFGDFLLHYTAHHQGQCFAENQCECVDNKRDNFFQVTDIKSCADPDFLNEANQRLVTSRCVLKYSYAYLFYNSEDTLKNMLFRENLDRLERFTEQLSYISENAITYYDRIKAVDMIEVVDRSLQTLLAGFKLGYQGEMDQL